MKPLSARIALPLLGLVALGVAALSHAGPLNPPPGPVAPSGRTLDEIYNAIQSIQGEKRTPITALPITITQSGSYYFPSNLSYTGGDAIIISASNVSIDLNGFALLGGAGGAAGTAEGIIVTQNAGPPLANRTNISIRNGTIQGFSGIGVDATFVSGGRFENLTITNNGKYGLVTGDACTIVRCVARVNRDSGFAPGPSNTVEQCIATANGVRPNSGSTNGFLISAGCVVRDCVANSNLGTGFNVTTQCNISGCQAVGNDISGIVAISNNYILNNNCNDNGVNVANGGGVTITGGSNRVEGNTCTGNDRNFDIVAVTVGNGNLIVRNASGRPSAGGVNYNIGGNNSYGQIITGSVAFSDCAAWSNITY